jgi:hypothetical protein
MTSPVSSASFHSAFCDALKRYREKTKNDLAFHPLTADLQNCKLPADILHILDKKYNIQAFIQSHGGDRSSEQWLNATFTVLASFSAAISEGVALVYFQTLTCKSTFFNCLFCRYFHPQRSSSLVSASFSLSVLPFARATHSDTMAY